MFAALNKKLVKHAGAQRDLIPNGSMNDNITMLSLVKVRDKMYWPVIKYTITDQTLLDLLEEAEDSPEYTEEVFIEDFKHWRGGGWGASAAAEAEVLGDRFGVSAGMDTVDRASSITLRKKKVDIKKLRNSLENKKVKKKILDALKLEKTEELMFVDQKIYNTGPVQISGTSGKHSSVSAACKTLLKLFVTGNKKEKTSFTVPTETTFAYSLMKITTEDGTLGIPPKTREVRHVVADAGEDDDDGETLQQVKTEIKEKEVLLQPLADLPESTRRDLLKTLCELLDNMDALSLLLDRCGTEVKDRPQSQAVSSFMDVLKAFSTSQKDAIHLLVDAMDSLPEGVPALLASCSPDTLRVLNQLVSSLKEDGQAQLPESLPSSLQEEGELRCAADFLCSTDDTLRELSELWDRPGQLLGMLCFVVQGLSLMQPTTHS